MGFAINPSHNYLQISESYILEFYRSQAEVALPDARFRGHPFEAYICITRVEMEMRAYVALLNTALQSVLVYTSDLVAKNAGDYPKVFREAEGFVKAMGFAMEPVNLDFSPAMREVILKGFRVMRPPTAQKKQLHRTPKVDVPVGLGKELEITYLEPVETMTGDRLEDALTEVQTLKAELLSLREALAQVTGEKISLEQRLSEELEALQSAAQQAMESRRQAEDRLKKELLELSGIEQTRQSRIEREALIETERLESIKQQREEISALKERLERGTAASGLKEKELADGLSALVTKVDILQREKGQLEQRLAGMSVSAGELVARAKTENEALESLLAAAGEELSIARNDLEKLSKERESSDGLLRNLSRTEGELADARSELAMLREKIPSEVEISAEISRVISEKEAVEAEYVRLATASREKEAALAESLSAAEADNERLSRELVIRVQVAAMEQESLRAELRRLIAEQHVAAPPLSGEEGAGEIPIAAKEQGLQSGLPQTGIQAETNCSPTHPVGFLQDEAEGATDESPDEPVPLESTVVKEFTNEFGGFYMGGEISSTEFAIDPSIICLEYHHPAEIVAVFYSSNSVQAVPDNSSIQRCRGYVIAMKQSGIYRVYVAWHLTESGKVVVCQPEQQPVDSDSCVQVLRDAISYFEIVGFMMDIADLGETVKSYNRALKKIPVLRLVPNN